MDNDPRAAALLPLFLKLAGRRVLLVGGGPIATAKAGALDEAGADVTVVAPSLTPELRELAGARGWRVHPREFEAADLEGAWLVVAAAPGPVNRAVADAAEARRVFVLAVDDVGAASAYGAGVIRRAGVTVAISTSGAAPALAGLLREGLEAALPSEADSDLWLETARELRGAWRAAGVPMAERRPRLLAALNALYASRPGATAAPGVPGLGASPTVSAGLPRGSSPDNLAAAGGPNPDTVDVVALGAASVAPARGRLTLVGAGPGAEDLLTLRAARRLGEADLVLYDALSSEAMRVHAPQARWFYVGKRACRQSIGQDTLNRLMVREARRGWNVVRLKCGDPFVFGRGGEEALALAEAGIPCEVVPGVSSSVAAPALAGIPVTHRGLASAFTVLSGHHAATYRPILESMPRTGMTLVFMMALGQRQAIAATMRELGWSPKTPAALVIGAATPAAWRWTGTLDNLDDLSEESAIPAASAAAPGLLVVGDVVTVATEVERLQAAAGSGSEVGKTMNSDSADAQEHGGTR